MGSPSTYLTEVRTKSETVEDRRVTPFLEEKNSTIRVW